MRLAPAALAVVMAVAACSPGAEDEPTAAPSPSVTPTETIATKPVQKPCTWKVGTLGAFSGRYEHIGTPIRNGIETGIKHLNADPQIPCKIKLISANSKGFPPRATKVARQLVRKHQLIACLCGYFSGEAIAIGEILADRDLLMASTGTDKSIRSYDFRTWLRVAPADDKHAVVAGSYIANGLGARRVVVVSDRDRYSRTMADGVARSLGDGVKARLTVTGNTDWEALAKRIKKKNPDAVYYGGYTREAAELKRWLRAVDVEADYLTDDGAFDPSFGDIINPIRVQLTCGCTVRVEEEGMRAFVEVHEELHTEEPGPWAAEMFDMTTFIGDALRTEKQLSTRRARQKVLRFLRSGEQHQGMVKDYRWDQGELVVEPDDVWVYEWDHSYGGQLGDFVPVGTVEQLIAES